MTIRPVCLQTDLPQIAAIITSSEPEAASIEDLRSWFTYNPPGRVNRRTVTVLHRAVDDQEEVVGYCAVIHENWDPAGSYYIWTAVDPAWRWQGVGTGLFEEAMSFLNNQGACRLTSEVRDNDPLSLRFACQRGFEMDRHLFESTLALADFDEAPFLPLIWKLEAQGMRFFSLADAGDKTEARRKLHSVNAACVLDIPGRPGEFMPFEEFEERICGAAWFRPEGQIVAAVGEEWVGLSAVQLLPETNNAYNLMTGVLPAYRGCGIAQALKVHALRYARHCGAASIRTNNDSANAPILAINRKLGYQPQPGKYLLSKVLAPE